MSGTCLEIRRSARKMDLFRRYRILVNGSEVGQVAWRGRLRVPVAAGWARVEARIDWAGAKLLDLFVAEGKTAVVEVGNTHGWKGAAVGSETISPGTYLTLKLLD